eukprot:TRINITY_DN97_c0_g1_i2.p1 TRINITY_DN97_c0_g1~~TRINITY_DN97_c0_g1_i2.p1  ORF type:complete len:197 (-),score=32.42 TRINITY_DN97_c0_g1_i2:139-729(-)
MIQSTLPTATRKLMVAVANSWIIKNDATFYVRHSRADIMHTIDMLFDNFISILSQLDCDPCELFVPLIMYCDRFIRFNGIRHDQLSNLLLASTMVTAKFWGETVRVNNKQIAQLFGYQLAELNEIELRFLMGLDYSFSLSKSEVEDFMVQARSEFEGKPLTPHCVPKEVFVPTPIAVTGTRRSFRDSHVSQPLVRV